MRKLKEILSNPTKETKLDEISSKALGSYIKKAADDVSYNSFKAAGNPKDLKDGKTSDKKTPIEHDTKSFKRQKGIEKAAGKLVKRAVKEDVDMDEDEWKESTTFEPEADANMNGTSQKGKITVSLAQLVRRFGHPHSRENDDGTFYNFEGDNGDPVCLYSSYKLDLHNDEEYNQAFPWSICARDFSTYVNFANWLRKLIPAK